MRGRWTDGGEPTHHGFVAMVHPCLSDVALHGLDWGWLHAELVHVDVQATGSAPVCPICASAPTTPPATCRQQSAIPACVCSIA
eukprot:99704-Chlamydomonas_euryale.AAC.1